MFGIKALCLSQLYRNCDINGKTGEIYQIDETITFPQSLKYDYGIERFF